MTDTASLTRTKARERSTLIAVRRYDIAVDLVGLFVGEVIETVSTITFTCTTPGATTFVDCVADIAQATLNGVDLDLSTADAGRLPLPGLEADNVLVVSASQSGTKSSAGVQRCVDGKDGGVYVWTSFEPDDARRVWACFDQPDLKAPHRFTVTAPESWTVTSNGAPESVLDAGGAARVWSFPDTPPLSTYVVVVNAGPFHELRSGRGGHDLGLYCRQSLAPFLDRDAEELFDLTAAGLAFYADRFGRPFPQERYDQVFVPDMGGAMENWGCVTWGDGDVYQEPPTWSERWWRAYVLLHEMAHMWFGDLVTMQWWDDLWLNEAFATWAGLWSMAEATEYTDAWATFLVAQKLSGYRADMAVTTHPIRGTIEDVDAAAASFDAITYIKGSSTLRQLVAYVGEDAFVAGLAAYFEEHAWGNTTLDDLMTAIGRAARRDLAGWTGDWLDRAGTDTLTLVERTPGRWVVTAVAPEGSPRPHRLDLGVYRRDGASWALAGTVPLEVAGAETPVPDLPSGELRLLNDEDLTFAACRTDAASAALLLRSTGELPSTMARVVAVGAAWDQLVKAELTSAAFVEASLPVIRADHGPVGEDLLRLVEEAVEAWTPAAARVGLEAQLAATCRFVSDSPAHGRAARLALARVARAAEDFAVLDAATGHDVELAWAVLTRRAELGDHDAAAVDALTARDPDPDSWTRSLAVRTACADVEAKEAAWQAVFRDRSVPAGRLSLVGAAFWRPSQADLLQPYFQRYLTDYAAMEGGNLALLSTGHTFYPATLADEAFADAAEAVAATPGVSARVSKLLGTRTDTLRRMLRARA